MKTKKFTLVFATVLLVSAAFVSSCKKKAADPPPPDTDTVSSNDNSMAETTANDVVSMAGQASENGSLSSYRTGPDAQISALSCATVTINSTTKIITATFGGACLDGRTRTGSLTFDYSSSTLGATAYRHPGFKCVITSQNYVIDGNQVTINKTITNTTVAGFNPATTNLTWTITSSISIVKANGGGTINWNCPLRTKTLLNTSDTSVYRSASIPIRWNKARIGIIGNSNCTSTNGSSFSVNITSELIRDMNCTPDVNKPGKHPFIQGAVNFTPNSKPTRYIDYGNGTCDLIYTVTINGTTYTLTLP